MRYKQLIQKQRYQKRVKRYDSYDSRGQLIDRISLTERKSCYTLIQKVERKTAQCVSNAIINLLSPFVTLCQP